MKTKSHLHIRALCEGAIMVALAFVLSFVKLYELPNGGSLTPAMFPILLYALRWGVCRGLAAGFVFGLLQLLFDGAYAWGWQSMLLDYLVAFTVLGLGGLFRDRIKNPGMSLMCGSLVALGARYLCHIVSGYVLFSGWAEWFFTQEGFPAWGAGLVQTLSPGALGWTYSIVYNGMYMIPEMILTAGAALLLAKIPRVAETIS